MTTKHTPGPWWAAQHDEFGRYDIGQGDAVIVRTIPRADSGPGEAPITLVTDEAQKANATLIAAAPELLEALKLALEEIKTGRHPLSTIQVCEQTIAKAEGR